MAATKQIIKTNSSDPISMDEFIGSRQQINNSDVRVNNTLFI